MKKVLITGATGFLGQALLQKMQQKRISVTGTTRRKNFNDNFLINIDELSEQTDWTHALKNKNIVIHCAGIAHSTPQDPKEFHRINVLATKRLLKQCITAGIKQFIYISSIGVNGNMTTDKAFTADDRPAFVNNYAKSKAECEKFIIDFLANKEMNYTIIRPPLIYGKKAPGNFGILLKILDRKIPLPLAGINNRRSFVGLENIVDLICHCILNTNAYNQIFLVSDNMDISTEKFLKKIGQLSKKPVYLFPFPKKIIKLLATLTGKETTYQGLFESLQIDITETCNKLNWNPPLSIDEGLLQCFDKEEK